MPCPHCAATATTEMIRRTLLGYRLFHCHACGRTCNVRTGTPLNHLQVPTDIVLPVVLWRVLRRLGVPVAIFINKIDRPGTQYERVLQSVSERLTPAIIPMGSTGEVGAHSARFEPYSAADADFTARLVDLLADPERDRLLAAKWPSLAPHCGGDLLEGGLGRSKQRLALSPPLC